MVEQNEFETGRYVTDLSGHTPERRQPGEISRSGAAPTASEFHAAPATNKAVVLSTKRLTLRPPAERDLDQLVTLANNPRVANNLGRMPHPYTREDGMHWVHTLSKPAPLKLTLAITDRYTDEFMGGCGYRASDDHPDRIAIGYWLGEPFWGQGFAAEAAKAIIDHAFGTEAIDTIWVTVRVSNQQSKRVIEKCGFQFAHNGMSRSLAVGGIVPIDYYSMSRGNWESLHVWGER